MSDYREVETFYAIHMDDFSFSFGDESVFKDHHKILTKKYINEATSTTSTSVATDTYKFLFPFHIKKKYWIEGIIEGQVTFAAGTAAASLDTYRVTICKVHENGTETELATTGFVTVNDSFAYNAVYGVGDEMVYAFFIDVSIEKEITEEERLYLKVETDSAGGDADQCVLWHSNDADFEDIMIEIPFRL